MAEPLSSLPIPPPKGGPIPWPHETDELETCEDLSQTFEESVERGRASFQRSWESVQRTFARIANQAEDTARYLRRERPLHVIAAVGIMSFIAGVGLRIWRSRHE